jgi:hypothetical protein
MSEKIEAFWSDATAEDVARVMAGETVEARFRDEKTQPWGDCYTLTGWVNELRHRWRSAEAGGRWNFCQVYREPFWYANKPDPGPGYRLLKKFPDEELKPGDDLWLTYKKLWEFSDNANRGQSQEHRIWYRRRIEPVESIQQVDTRVFLQVGDRVRHPSGFLVVVTEKGFEVMQ